MKRLILGAASAVLATTLAATTTLAADMGNDRFKQVLERGKLVVGVKADYKPWGFRDPSGAIIGMEADMAQDGEEGGQGAGI